MIDCIIREAEPKDAGELLAFVDIISREEGIQIALGPGELDLTLREEIMFIEAFQASDNSVFFVAEFENQIIGTMNINGGKRKALRHNAELGISIAKDFRSKGIGSQMMQTAVNWVENNPIIKRLELKVFSENKTAIHLYKKYGFEIEGTRRALIYRDGSYHDSIVMARLFL